MSLTSAPQSASTYNPDPRAHPGLHAIALFEAGKGVAAVLVALALAWTGPASLQHVIHAFAVKLHLNPAHGVLASVSRTINPESVGVAIAVASVYALIRFIEAWGLWHARAWGSWLGCIGAAVYLPIELYAMLTHPGILEASILLINLVVVWVLARDLLKRRR